MHAAAPNCFRWPRKKRGRSGIRDEERSGGKKERENEGSICLSSDYNVQVMSPAAVAVVGRYVKKYICWMDGSHAHSVQMPESKLRQYKCGHVTFTEIGLQPQATIDSSYDNGTFDTWWITAGYLDRQKISPGPLQETCHTYISGQETAR